jgi:hypothetical protein
MDLELMEERTLLSAVHPLFDLTALTTSPFPSDRFTVPDNTQNTGRRVDLPSPNSTTNPSDYNDTQVINTLDGFNLQPRLSIPFDGLIDVSAKSVNSHDIFLVSLGDTLPGGDKGGEVVGINQIVWDPPTKTLHVESDQLLDQHTTYALIVTNGVLDATGQPVQASDAFTRFRHDLNFGQAKDPVLKDYRKELLDAMAAARQVGVSESDIVVASVFTTQSATAILEKIRDQIDAAPAPTADFNVGLNGKRTVFNLNDVTNIELKQQTTVSGPLTPVNKYYDTLLSFLRAVPDKPDAVGQVAYGMYRSPDYEFHPTAAQRAAGVPGEYIPAVGTRTGTPAVQGYNEIYFTLFLPSGQEPEGGWPVAIFGQGANSNKDGNFGVPMIAAELAANQIATIGINTVGFGYGPLGTITVTESNGSVTVPAGGRGIDQDLPGTPGYGTIGISEGSFAASPQAIIEQRDGIIQTAADLMQLVRVIKAGVDVDPVGSPGHGSPDLDTSRIYYVGVSMGGGIGASFLAVEPDVSVGALVVLGGPAIEKYRLSLNRGGVGVVGGLSAANILASRTPSLINGPGSLINGPGITQLDGMDVSAPYFDENMPLRDGVPLNVTVRLPDGTTEARVIQSPVTNDVPGAMAIQEVFDNYEWVSQPSNSVAYAPHLRKAPLPGVPAKSVLIGFAKGDPLNVNPATTAFLRAGDLADRATYYRYDLAFPGQDPNQRPSLAYPHTFGALITSANPTLKAVALAAQQQIATFLATPDHQIIQPPGVPSDYFEVPIEGTLPEGLNYTIPTSAPASAPAQVSGSQASVAIPTATASNQPNGKLLNSPLTAAHVPASSSPAPTPALIDMALEALPSHAWVDSGVDVNDLASGLLQPARRRR